MAKEHYDPWSNSKTRHGLGADLVISALQKCIRRADEATAMRMAYELYVTSPSHEEKMWSRLLVISVEDIGFGEPYASILIKNLNDMRREFPYGSGDRAIFFLYAVRYLCRCKKERSTDHIKGIIKRESARGEVPEIPDVAIDMHTALGRARGRDIFHFLDEASKVIPEWEEYDDSYYKELYRICREEAEEK